MKKYIFFLVGTLLLMGGYFVLLTKEQMDTPRPPSVPTKMAQDRNGNFIIYVNNQSSALDTVDIIISIDGAIAVNQNFPHNHKHQDFRFSLSNGNHKLYVVSVIGEAKLEKEFNITERHWAVVDYWYYPPSHYTPTPRQFRFDIQDNPIYFE